MRFVHLCKAFAHVEGGDLARVERIHCVSGPTSRNSVHNEASKEKALVISPGESRFSHLNLSPSIRTRGHGPRFASRRSSPRRPSARTGPVLYPLTTRSRRFSSHFLGIPRPPPAHPADRR